MKRLRAALHWLDAALDSITRARLYLVALLTLLLVAHGIFPEQFIVDNVSLALAFLLILVVLVPILQSATLPGGGGFKFREDIKELQREADQATSDQSAINSGGWVHLPDAQGAVMGRIEQAEAILRTVLEEAARSPRVGLMLLSAELESAVRKLLAVNGWDEKNTKSLRAGIDRLVEVGVLARSTASAVSLFSEVRNRIVHGVGVVPDSEILAALDSGVGLLRSVLLVPMERRFVAEIDVVLYRGADSSLERRDCRGVSLKFISPIGVERLQVFPTQNNGYYQVGKEVAWSFTEPTIDESWYLTADGTFAPAWSNSMSFDGRHIDEI